jgi:Ca2+-binding RTX toxin-like protein
MTSAAWKETTFSSAAAEMTISLAARGSTRSTAGPGFDFGQLDWSGFFPGEDGFIFVYDGVNAFQFRNGVIYGQTVSVERFEIDGSDGNDWIETGDDNDSLEERAGSNVLIGHGGADVLIGGDGGDYLDGGDGHDILVDFAGSNQLLGGSGDDLLHLFGLGVADDQLLAGRSFVDGGVGNDEFAVSAQSTAQAVTIYADTAFSVYLSGVAVAYVTDVERHIFLTGSGDDTLLGGSGDDLFRTGSGADVVNGGGGADRLELGDGLNQGYGGDGDDSLSGGRDRDVLVGGAGNDLIDGDTANDLLIGDEGNDSIIGPGTIFAGPGDDQVFAIHASADLGTGADQLMLSIGTNFAQLGEDGVRDVVNISVNTGSSLDLTYQFSDLGTGNSNAVWGFESGVDQIDAPPDVVFSNSLDLDGDGSFNDAKVVAPFPLSNFEKITVFVDTFLNSSNFI